MTNAEALYIIRNTAWIGGEHQEQVAQAVDVITKCFEELKEELKRLKRQAMSFLNSDFAIGYISAISAVEEFLANG